MFLNTILVFIIVLLYFWQVFYLSETGALQAEWHSNMCVEPHHENTGSVQNLTAVSCDLIKQKQGWDYRVSKTTSYYKLSFKNHI